MHCLGGNKGKRQTCAVTHRTVAHRALRYGTVKFPRYWLFGLSVAPKRVTALRARWAAVTFSCLAVPF